VGIMPGRVFVSEIPSDLLPGIVEAVEFIGGLEYGSDCRESMRLPEPESLDWHPVNVRPANAMPVMPRINLFHIRIFLLRPMKPPKSGETLARRVRAVKIGSWEG
jgi:hypothetical protein